MSFQDRYEYLFVFDATQCNPNGDPLDENRPRTDPETGQALVTDVRIKRTIREAILAANPDTKARLDGGVEILIRDTHVEDSGYLKTGNQRADDFKDKAAAKLKGPELVNAVQAKILEACVDVRLFGSTLPLGKKEASLKITGPVQFGALNPSLHAVSPRLIQQTAAFAGGEGKTTRSLAERQLLPYALIAVTGVANENAARLTGASDDDLRLMESSLWNGTRDLASTSKFGHRPLLLVRARYRSGHQLGGLGQRIELRSDVEDVELRSTRQCRLDLGRLLGAWSSSPGLTSVWVRQDPDLVTCDGDTDASVADLLRQRKIAVED